MAYYFAVETTISSFEAANIRKTERFKKTFPNSSENYECTLEEIDAFTTQYNDEKHLINDLACDRVIPLSYYNRPISIIYQHGIEVRKVTGDMLYSDSKKYIENPTLVIEYILNKITENDYTFYREILKTLPETSITTSMIAKLATLMEEGENISQLNDVTGMQVLDIARALIFDCYIADKGQLQFSNKIDYEKFHNTIAFISIYENKIIKKQSNVNTLKRKPQ